MTVLAWSVYLTLLPSAAPGAAALDLTEATVVARPGDVPEAERTAAIVLVEEVEKRTGRRWAVRTEAPAVGAVIELTARGDKDPALKPEGFALSTAMANGRPRVRVAGADGRGVLFGVGKLLRTLRMSDGAVTIEPGPPVVSSPTYPLRGHQLGYRNRANSWDAWDLAQFDQYVRELALFGSNCVENIPFQDDSPGLLMRVPRPEMNVRLSEICRRYDQDYWLWTPADFDLADEAKRQSALREHETLYAACPRLDAVFVPGGDPGDNKPELVLPFLKDLAERLQRHHPRARVWLSLQGFHGDDAEFVYRYLEREKPEWFGGIVCGPSSPSIASTRQRLDPRYPIRHYPDITHNVRAQYPVAWWDPALAFTLGREAINPRPQQFAEIHNAFAPQTIGFLSYSDGVHDDVNKIVWSARAWDPTAEVRGILIEYARVFLASEIAEEAADGILALERNWQGSLRENGGVEATQALWQDLEERSPRIAGTWRGQMLLLRAVYDAWTRHRLIHETALEEQANAALTDAATAGSGPAMDRALAILARAQSDLVHPELRRRIDELCEALYGSIGLQTSQTRHQASGAERGCVLDFADHPLNNRWWLEDQFAAIRTLPDEPSRRERLERLRTWEHPGPGSFYDQVGHIGRSPHVLKGDYTTLGRATAKTPIPEVLWWDSGRSRERPAWMVVMNWPLAMLYDDLDPDAEYVIRTTGFGTCLMSIDGERVEPTRDGRDIGEIKEFPVPRRLLADGTLRLTFERPKETVNWRYQSRLSELWLLKVKK